MTKECTECASLKKLLKIGLEIHDEYLSQIAHCVSQDYAKLNTFPILCKQKGVVLGE